MLLLLLAGCSGVRPADLGVHDGRLRPCPTTPNCVCSQAPRADEEHYIAPLRYRGSRDQAFDLIYRIVTKDLSRMKVVTRTERYMHIEATSLIFRFVDDVELYAPDGAKRIEVRSASRLGYSDFGVNRSRIEDLRERFEAAEP